MNENEFNAPPKSQQPSGGDEITNDSRTLAAVCHATFFTSGLVALILYLVKKDTVSSESEQFAVDEAKEALNFQICLLCCSIGLNLFGAVTLGFGYLLAIPAMSVVFIYALVVSIMAAVKVYAGQPYRYSITFRFIK
ncbi:MAG: DUF4870 domain-containing protein [Pirellulaceae bacterium]|nr:DUF4870 domain-containing protein [Pirellulaceae bacterium]